MPLLAGEHPTPLILNPCVPSQPLKGGLQVQAAMLRPLSSAQGACLRAAAIALPQLGVAVAAQEPLSGNDTGQVGKGWVPVNGKRYQ